jgi:hypothetical protein
LPGTGSLPEQFSATDRGKHLERFVVEFSPAVGANLDSQLPAWSDQRAIPVAELLPSVAQCLLLLAVLVTPPSAACPKCGVGVLLRTSILPAYPWLAKPPNTS